MSNAKTLHLQWADGEIEAGTLIDALYEQERTISMLRQHKNDYMGAAEATKKYLEAELAKLRAPQPSAVPDGWKLVPVEPTPHMLMAADRATDEQLMLVELGSAYSAMLAAAPSAPATVHGGWRNHSVNFARAERCPQTVETLQAAWDRDQELVEEQRLEIARLKQTINQLRQKATAQGVNQQLLEALEELLDCPAFVEEATVPKAGIEAAPEQVVMCVSVALPRWRKTRAAIAAARQEGGKV